MRLIANVKKLHGAWEVRFVELVGGVPLDRGWSVVSSCSHAWYLAGRWESEGKR